MGQTSIYLFAKIPRPHFIREAIEALVAAEIIDAEESDGMYFTPADSELSGGFEYLGVHQSPLPFIIPQDPAVFPTCPSCGVDVSDTFYETINDCDDEGVKVDWSKLSIVCPKCGTAHVITTLKDPVGIFCAKEYLYFSDANMNDIEEFAEHLKRILRDTEVKTYRYT